MRRLCYQFIGVSLSLFLGEGALSAKLDEALEPEFLYHNYVILRLEPEKGCGYLRERGFLPELNRVCCEPEYDRTQLLSIQEMEEILKDVIEPEFADPEPMKLLDEAHEGNLKKVHEMESAGKVIVVDEDLLEEEAPLDLQGFNDILLFLEKDKDNKGDDAIKIPFEFQMPYQSPPRRMEAPSRALYERI